MNLKALALSALLLFQDGAKTDNSGVERLLRATPEDAAVVLSTRDFDSIRAQLESNSWWKFGHEPSFQGWMDGLWSAVESDAQTWDNSDAGDQDPEEAARAAEEAAQSAAKARVVLAQIEGFLKAVHGPCVAFARFDSFDDGALGVLVDPGAERAAFESWVDQLLETLFADSPKETVAYEGVELRMFENPAAASGADADSGDELLIYFELFGTAGMVLGPKREAALSVAHGVIDRLRAEDGAQGVLGNARFQSSRVPGDAPGRVELFVDIARLLEIDMRENPPDEESRKEMELFGVGDLTWARALCDIGQGEQLDFEVAFALPRQGALARMLSHLRPCSEAFVRSIPRDATTISLFGLDVAGLWKEGWALAAEMNPEGTAEARKQMDEGAKQALGGADIEADLIEQLTGDMASFTVAVPEDEWRAGLGAALEMMSEEARAAIERSPKVGNAFVIGLVDGKVVEGFVDQVLESAGMAAGIEVEEFQGDSVSMFEIPGTGTISWVFQDRRLVVSQYPTALRALLAHKPAADGASVYQHPRLGQHLTANKGAAMLTLASTAESLKTLEATFGALGAMLPSNPVTSLFTSGWPPPEAIDRLFSGTMLMSLTRTPSSLSLRVATR